LKNYLRENQSNATLPWFLFARELFAHMLRLTLGQNQFNNLVIFGIPFEPKKLYSISFTNANVTGEGDKPSAWKLPGAVVQRRLGSPTSA
jgi:hypothetical protein